uniref:PS II complex 12 kDa extrinsic protein n=1 Tax=Corethron hystrix TaxID=216773 RepID=A0A6U5LAC2_9STRA|mmetsp:Transcript_4637/g.9056  ORF Transcript_4637/g.9056 Transcript_4637/m.9056 type:complete len:112 (+) Transcript_4637:300-635(+)
MKLSVVIVAASVGLSAAFAPSAPAFTRQNVALEAQQTRANFLGAAAAATFAAAFGPGAAIAGTMAQENVADPTEQWETGSPTKAALDKRVERYTNARTQMTSNFAPQKRVS